MPSEAILLKLYYYPNNASLAPHFLLHHVQAEYELVLVDKESNFQKSVEYLKLNPVGRIPTLVVGNQSVFESPAICTYICELFPEFDLMPPIGNAKRPLFFQWLAYLNNTLQAELMIYYYPHRHTNDENAVPSILAAQADRIMDALSIVDSQLEGNEYLLGGKISACDYFLFMLAEWSLPIMQSPMAFTNLPIYLERLCRNTTVKTVCKLEGISLKPFENPS